MSGEQPKTMGILPFGCRAHVVRPKEFVVKSRIDAHACGWVNSFHWIRLHTVESHVVEFQVSNTAGK